MVSSAFAPNQQDAGAVVEQYAMRPCKVWEPITGQDWDAAKGFTGWGRVLLHTEGGLDTRTHKHTGTEAFTLASSSERTGNGTKMTQCPVL